jgi:phosphoglycolate phosphatase-like HAD superfamily hydrolase
MAALPTPLVLFDIDGTLLRRSGPQHRRVLEEAAQRVLGVPATTDGIPLQGMLDRDILHLMLRDAGVKPRAAESAMPEMMRVAQNLYARRAPDLRRRVCPGARMLLWRLFRKNTPTGLVTGNFSRIGWKKMERAGLRHYFRFGAFAEAARDRAGLVKLAVREARRAGWISRHSPVTLIGDHINDIRAAQANSVRVVAVATGVLTLDELRAHGPDLAVPDLRALPWEFLFRT